VHSLKGCQCVAELSPSTYRFLLEKSSLIDKNFGLCERRAVFLGPSDAPSLPEDRNWAVNANQVCGRTKKRNRGGRRDLDPARAHSVVPVDWSDACWESSPLVLPVLCTRSCADAAFSR